MARRLGRDPEEPDWGPLLDVVGEDLVGWFMWMFAARTRSGRTLQAYKHIGSRRYLHLDSAGAAYAYLTSGRYRPIDLADALEVVIRAVVVTGRRARGGRGRCVGGDRPGERVGGTVRVRPQTVKLAKKYREVRRMLRSAGGSHETWRSPEGRLVTVAGKDSDSVPAGTLLQPRSQPQESRRGRTSVSPVAAVGAVLVQRRGRRRRPRVRLESPSRPPPPSAGVP
jgi:hypothetical protein